MHIPEDNSANLSKLSGKQFEGLHKDLLACIDVPLLLLTNIAPQLGLFNGAICHFKGLLYLPDHPDITLKTCDLKKITFNNLALQKPLDLKAHGTYYKQFHQLPVGSTLKAINGTPVTSHEEIDALVANHASVKCAFHIPKCPPTLPYFIVLECDAYKERGGPNILRFAGAENLIPIPCMKVQYNAASKTKKSKSTFGYRIGFKLEPAIVVTPYKEQGRTESRLKLEIKNQAKVPGLWYVSISRTVHPKHNYIPEGEWPSAMDINLQRLNPFVNEEDIFEWAVKIQSAKTLRNWSVAKGNIYGACWNAEECEIADMIAMAYTHKYRKSLSAIASFIQQKYDKCVPDDLLKKVIAKMDKTHESLLKEDPPYLKDEEYKNLANYAKGSNRSSKNK